MNADADDRDGQHNRELVIVSLLTLYALLVHGYHPATEDGGIYIAGVKRLLHPQMYGQHPAFVEAPMHTSLFAPTLAAAARSTQLPLPWLILLVYCAATWLTLYAASRISTRCFATQEGRSGAVALLACWLSLPVAGTSLLLMDPYVSARSLSTPLLLLALRGALDQNTRGWRLAGAACLSAFAMHPLMAGYGCALIVATQAAFLRTRRSRVLALIVYFTAALALALVVQACGPPESSAYVRALLTRYYWFPLQWQWYEQLGALAPAAVIVLLAGFREAHGEPANQSAAPRRALARGALTLCAAAIAIALLFAHPGLRSHAVARLQPLRCLQPVYLVMILLLGDFVGRHWLRAHPLRWAAMLFFCAVPLYGFARSTYPADVHLELPWRTPHTPWQSAFLWARSHTPPDAIFALDSRYITQGAGEDAQCFRVIAERDALPDYSKDGGEASIDPSLASAWSQGVDAQTGLDLQSDAARLARLRPLGASWLVLGAESSTAWDCPYRNQTVKVCRLP